MSNRTNIFQKQGKLRATEVNYYPDSKTYLMEQSINEEFGRLDLVGLTENEAIQIAMSILKNAGILPEVTTIAELEKQGKL